MAIRGQHTIVACAVTCAVVAMCAVATPRRGIAEPPGLRSENGGIGRYSVELGLPARERVLQAGLQEASLSTAVPGERHQSSPEDFKGPIPNDSLAGVASAISTSLSHWEYESGLVGLPSLISRPSWVEVAQEIDLMDPEASVSNATPSAEFLALASPLRLSKSAQADRQEGVAEGEPTVERLPLSFDRTIADPVPVATDGLSTEVPPIEISPAVEQRPRIIFQPAVPAKDATGQMILRPSVRLADPVRTEVLPTPMQTVDVPMTEYNLWGNGRIRLAAESELQSVLVDESEASTWATRGGERRVDDLAERFWKRSTRWAPSLISGIADSFERHAIYDVGVGRERLPFALFEMDSTQPLNNFRIRFDAAYNMQTPDRAEFFWSKLGGRGPALSTPVESSIDYQDIRCRFEMGGDRFSTATEIPLRFLRPSILGNTGGIGDIVLTAKTLLIDGDRIQLSQVLRTELNNGSVASGRGNGNVSLEPGVVGRYEWNDDTMIHSELKIWVPLGGDINHSGEVLRYGVGFAHVLYETNTFAMIPTMEFVSWSVLSGQKTVGGTMPETIRVDGDNILNIYPGMRFVRDGGGDLGLFELGFGGGLSVTSNHWYQGLLRLDLRWSF